MKTLREQIVSVVKDAFGINPTDVPEMKPNRGLFIKDKDGNYSKWFGVYSNSFRDDDLVPEILESNGHVEFVKGVDAGIYNHPELWIWHNPKWKIGKAAFVAVDAVRPGVVFAIAGGDIDPEHYGVAKAIAESDVEWRMSHTFVSHNRNNSLDSYVKWVTLEVSILPAGKEANPLTSFGLLSQSEETMIEAKKREEMKDMLGISDAELDSIESHNASLAAEAVDNREFKGKSEETSESDATEQAAEGDVEAKETEVTEDVAELNEETAEVEEEVVTEEVADGEAIGEEEQALVDDGNMLSQFADLLKSMDQRMDQLQATVEAAEAKATKLEEQLADEKAKEAELSPVASMAGMQSLFAKYSGGTDSVGAEVDEEEDAELLKSKPEEAETRKEITSKFNSPLLSKFIAAGS